MIESEVIIVGGGPGGASCAWKLKQNNVECIILDKEDFPRTKLCAGWVTPKVYKILRLDDYPHNIVTFDKIGFSIFGIKKKLKALQYSIRRYEFDDWLLKKSKAKVYKHEVRLIEKKDDYYIIDGQYKCKYLIGAGGSFCPVYRTFFEKINPRSKKRLATAMEQEFKYDYKDEDCLLWFFENKLPGYSWYVPKGNEYINIGIGGFLKKKNIREQWDYFVKRLEKEGLIENYEFKPKGYIYYVRSNVKKIRIDNAFVVGDALGLATLDLAEGIGPAIESGILAAESIVNNKEYSIDSIEKNSLKGIASFLIKLGIKLI